MPGRTLRSLIDAEAATPRFEVVTDTRDLDGGVVTVLAYESESLRVRASMRRPTNGAGPHPAVVFVRGHTITPRAASVVNDYRRWQSLFVAAGFVVVAPELRGHGESDGPDDTDLDLQMGATADVINALRATADLPEVDSARIAVVGHSLGGVTALNVGVVAPDLVGAVVALAPGNASPWHSLRHFTEGMEWWSELLARHGTIDEQPAFWAGVSPLTYLDRLTAPVLVVHGTADAVAPSAWSASLVAALREAGAEVTARIVEGGGHDLETTADAIGAVAPETAIAFLAAVPARS